MDTLDLGTYAEVGLMATDTNGLATDGERKLTLTTVAGDHTAGVHVEENMWLNIDFNSSAVLSFDVTLYEVFLLKKHATFVHIYIYVYRKCSAII